MLDPLALPALLRVPSEVAPALPITPLPATAPAELAPAKLPEEVSDLFPALAPMAVPDCKSLAAAPCRPLLVMVAFAAAFVEVLELTCPSDLPAETEVSPEAAALLCEVAEVCARAVPTIRLPKTNEARTIFIGIILRKSQGMHPGRMAAVNPHMQDAG